MSADRSDPVREDRRPAAGPAVPSSGVPSSSVLGPGDQTLLFNLLKSQRETEDPDAIIVRAVETIGRHLGVNRCGFFEMPTPDVIDYGLCWSDGVLGPLSGPWAAANIGTGYREAKRQGRNPGIADVTTDPLTADARFMELGARAVVSAAIQRGGRMVAGIYCHHAAPRPWPQSEIELIRDAADLTWDAVERARSVRLLRESEQRFRLLSAIDEATRAVHGAQEVMDVTTRMLGEYLGAARCAYADIEDDGNHYTIRTDYCAPGVASVTGHYSLDGYGLGLLGFLSAGNTLVLSDVTRQVPEGQGRERFHAMAADALIIRPLVKDGRMRALMGVNHAHPHDWTASEIRMVEAVAERCWAHIERIRSEEALRELARAMSEARNAAEQASIAKTDFLANMSHEIRTPMNAVIGASQILLRSQPLTERQEKLIGVLNDSATALMELINQVLDLSKIEARNLQLDHAPFDARDMVDEIVRMMTLQARAKSLFLTVRSACACMTERPFVGDAARIRQILVNLTGNAIKFTETGGVTITIACTHGADAEIEDLVFTVSDTGIGIARDKLGVIFHKFSQADSSINRKYGGSGLGLSIARSLTEAMGGTLAAESEEGRGSTFTVTLPLNRAAPGEPDNAGAAGARPTPVHPSRILLVEDSPANVMVAGHFLQEFGYEYDVAEDGRSAVDYVREGRAYGAVLMDVQMPGMDGLEATRLIREHEASGGGRRIPIIAMTAHAMVADRQRCLAAGMDDYIAKPFNPATLRAKLLDLVD